jgi:DNA-binding response OmpR family regulator
MERRLFLFEWQAEAAEKRAAALGAAGWAVELECEDGARGVRRVLDQQPAMVVLDLARRPAHSRE